MTETILKPIIYRDEWHILYFSYIYNHLKEIIFMPLLKTTAIRIDNAKYDALEKAIIDGDINYVDGVFVGEISSAISKDIKALGGKMVSKKWTLDEYQLPYDLRVFIKKRKNDQIKLMDRINKKLDDIAINLTKFIKTSTVKDIGNQNINVVSKQFRKTVRTVLTVRPELDVKGMEKIQRDYLTTTDLPIREKLLSEFEDRSKAVLTNISQEIVEKFRKDLHTMILDGSPRRYIEEFIGERLKINKNRWKFIARQETALLTSKFKQSQYQQWGIKKYKWKALHDHKTRLRHMELDGDIISWDNPPKISEKGQEERYGHAGEDYNCRCIASPIVEWK